MDECYYYAWNLFQTFFLFTGDIFSISPWQKGLSTSNLEYDKSQTIYFPHIIQGLILQNLFLS